MIETIKSMTMPLDEKLDRIAIFSTTINAIFALSFSLYFSITQFNFLISLVLYPILFLNFAPLWWGFFFKSHFILAKLIYLFFSFVAVFFVNLILGADSNVHLISLTIVIDSMLFLGFKNHRYISVFALLTLLSFLIPLLKLEVPGLLKPEYLQTNKDYFRLAIEAVVMVSVFFKMLILAKLVDVEQSRAENAVNNLTQAVKDKEFLLRTLLHDVRAPLASCLVAFKNFLNSDFKNKERHPSLISIESGHHTMKEIIDNISMLNSDFSSINLMKTDVLVKDLLNSALSLCQSRALEKKIFIRLNSSDSQAKVNVDRDTVVYQVLGNILSNGIKFSKPNSDLEIDIETGATTCQIVIRNEGQFHEKTLNNQDFSTPGTWGEKGSGSGLSISRRFADINNIDFNLYNRNQFAIVNLQFRIVK